MKAFQDFIRNNLYIYADMCRFTYLSIDENGFNWITECKIKNSEEVYKIYTIPRSHTKALKENIKIPKLLTREYGYYIENNCVIMYVRKGHKIIDKTLITLMQCHEYALFIHTFVIGIGGETLSYFEDKCINEGNYFTVQTSKDNGSELYKLKGISTKTFCGSILASEWRVNNDRINVDIRNTFVNEDIYNGETISECIVRDCTDGTRQCICIDAYIGTDSEYNIHRQHNNNVRSIKSEASHKGLDLLLRAGDASLV